MNNINPLPTGQGRTRRNVKSKTLPKPRSNLTTLLVYFFSFVFFIASFILSEVSYNFVQSSLIMISFSFPSLFFVELLCRMFHLMEERNHLISRYDNNYLMLLQDVFYFPPLTTFIVLFSIFIHIVLFISFPKSPLKMWYEMGIFSVLSSFCGAFMLERHLGLKSGPLYDSLWIENSNGLDYGSGIAHSLFHGYLKLVIPKTGTSEKHLEELMKDYEDEHGVTLEFYKLFLLIPKSLYCPTSLKNDEISPSIEESSSLREKIITVAGVQNRVYKNSVYKIRYKDKTVYVCAEYATPLKTFKDVVSNNGQHSSYYRKHKNDIVLQFYSTLQKVLKENENCTNFCELIFYDDKDENGRYKDVGQILLNRIRKLKENR